MILATLLFASAAVPAREYFTERPDALGAYMRCASKALDDDLSVGQLDALRRIAVECRSFREEAIRIFVPLYHQRINSSAPIVDPDVANRTIMGVVLAEQMRRETENPKAE